MPKGIYERKPMSEEEKKMRSKSAKEKGMGLWMKKVWKEGRASPNSLKALRDNNYSMEGKKHNKESKRKMSSSRIEGLNSGRIKVWNKGLKIKKGSELYEKIFSEEIRKKISKSNTGKIRTPEMKERYSKAKKGYQMGEKTKQKISMYQQGVNKDKWKGFISFEPYDPNFNNKFKNLIRKRDNQICMLCLIHREKLNRALDVHHINYNKKLTIKENCISLCHSCHLKANGNRKHWTKFFQSLLSEKYEYNYSELNEPIIEIKEVNC